MVHRERGDGRDVSRKGAQWNLLAGWRTHVNHAQELRILPVTGRGLHNHVVLVEWRIHGGHLALPECVVERVVDELWRDTEARGGAAVVFEDRLEAVVLLVGVDVADFGRAVHGLEHARTIYGQVAEVFADHRELIESAAGATSDAEALCDLKIEGRAGDDGELRPQAGHDGVGADAAFLQPFEVNVDSRRIGGVAAAEAVTATGITVDPGNSRILLDDLDELANE